MTHIWIFIKTDGRIAIGKINSIDNCGNIAHTALLIVVKGEGDISPCDIATLDVTRRSAFPTMVI